MVREHSPELGPVLINYKGALSLPFFEYRIELTWIYLTSYLFKFILLVIYSISSILLLLAIHN